MLGATVVVLVLAAAGCGGGGVDEADATATTVEPSTRSEPISPPTGLTDEQAVLTAYQGYWDTWLAANDPPNPDHPDLARFATGAALAKVRESIANHRAVGQVLRLPANSISEHRSRVTELDGGAAVVSDCSIDDGLVVAYGSGVVLNDAVGTWLLRTMLKRSGDTWLVDEIAVDGSWEGVAGCAA